MAKRQRVKITKWRTKDGAQRMIRLYSVFRHMHKRCSNPNIGHYHRYGGRGIDVCPEWSDYSAFREWAINSGYKLGLSLDRIDNDAGYSPQNCKWSTMKEQAQNRHDNPPKGRNHWNYRHGRFVKTSVA